MFEEATETLGILSDGREGDRRRPALQGGADLAAVVDKETAIVGDTGALRRCCKTT